MSHVPPGSGWPGDPATPATPVARTATAVRRLARGVPLDQVDARVSVCRACPRLVRWREEVAETKRAAYATETYWGRPVAGWGSPTPGVLIVGLAPAAHGANRTGRIFTGDRSGDWLFASLHRVGLATQPTSVSADDGQTLVDTRMVATVRCAPPQNKPTVVERDTCAPWLLAELGLVIDHVRVVVALGTFGWDASLRSLRMLGWSVAGTKPRFGHGAEVGLVHRGETDAARSVTLLGCYHPSQQNTFTGRLTASMLDDVLGRAALLAGRGPAPLP